MVHIIGNSRKFTIFAYSPEFMVLQIMPQPVISYPEFHVYSSDDTDRFTSRLCNR